MPRRYADVCERYRTLERHSVAIETNELELAHSLAEKWRELYVFARTKDLRLAKVKEDFRAVTTEQSEAFQEELKALRTQFYSDGPIAGKVTLEEGVLLMVDYAETLAKCVAKKDELVNAEDLFGASRGVLDADAAFPYAVDAASRRWRGGIDDAIDATRFCQNTPARRVRTASGEYDAPRRHGDDVLPRARRGPVRDGAHEGHL